MVRKIASPKMKFVSFKTSWRGMKHSSLHYDLLAIRIIDSSHLYIYMLYKRLNTNINDDSINTSISFNLIR